MTPIPSIEQIRHALTSPRPGLSAWTRMMPQPRNLIPPPDRQPREAGVLLLLYPLDEMVHLVLTRRTEGLATHSGQISLPGGGVKPGETPAEAALREADEELGIPRTLDVLGELTPIYIPPSNYLMYPLVAYAASRPDFIPDPREVAEVVEVPLTALLATETQAEEIWELRGVPTRIPFYRIGPHKVWGATAMVLAEFTVVLENIIALTALGSDSSKASTI